MATLTTLPTEFVSLVATEMVRGVEAAVETWLAQVELALTDRHLTSLGRLNAVHEVLENISGTPEKCNANPLESEIPRGSHGC